jgi:hypothetical protein
LTFKAQPSERRLTIYELIDWVRLLGTPLNQKQTKRLWGAVREVWSDGLVEVVKYLDVPDVRTNPEDGVSVWEAIVPEEGEGEDAQVEGEGMDVDEAEEEDGGQEDDDEEAGEEGEEKEDFDPRYVHFIHLRVYRLSILVRSDLPFEYLLVHALPRHLLNPKCQEVLAHCALNYCGFDPSPISSSPLTSGPSSNGSHMLRLQYITRHILRRFSVLLTIQLAEAARALLFVLSSVLEQVKVDDDAAFGSVKALAVDGLKELLGAASPPTSTFDAESLTTVRQGVLSVLKVVLDSSSSVDRALVADIASGWIDVLKKVVAGELQQGADAQFAREWVQYAQPGELLDVLDGILQRPEILSDALVSRVTSSCLRALKDAPRAGQQLEFRRHLSGSQESMSLLFRLHSLLLQLRTNAKEAGMEEEERDKADGVKVVEELIATVLESEGIPIGLMGEQAPSTLTVDRSLRDAVEDAEVRWGESLASYARRGGASVSGEAIRSFLSQPLEDWTDATEKIVCSFLYRQTSGGEAFVGEVAQWAAAATGQLGDDDESRGYFIGVTHALLDCILHREQTPPANLIEEMGLAELLLQEVILGGRRKGQAKAALQFLVELSMGDEVWSDSVFAFLERRMKSLRKSVTSSSASTTALASELINFPRWLTAYTTGKSGSERAVSIGNEVVEIATQWLVRKLGDEEGQKELEPETSSVCVSVTDLMKVNGVACKATTLETLLGVVTQSQYHVAHPECLEVLDRALQKASLKVSLGTLYEGLKSDFLVAACREQVLAGYRSTPSLLQARGLHFIVTVSSQPPFEDPGRRHFLAAYALLPSSLEHLPDQPHRTPHQGVRRHFIGFRPKDIVDFHAI